MNLSKMAWRNLWRRKRRTLITAFSIGFGVMLAVTFTGIGDYSYTNMINASAISGFGHVTIEPLGYNQSPSLDKRLREADQIRSNLLGMAGVSDAITRIIGQAIFASASKTIGGIFMAVDPVQESGKQNLLVRSLIEGEMFSSGEGRGAVIGSKMAEKLNLHIGKKMVYTTTDINGEIVSEIARVKGIFKTGADEVDGTIVLLPINRARAVLQYKSEDATLVAITINDQRYAKRMRDKIINTMGKSDWEVLSWQQTQADLAGLLALDRSGNYISQVLIGLLIAAGILNTILMSVLERNREFGVMLAIGMSPATLFKLILVESVWLALTGLVVGIIITTPWYAYLHNIGIDFSGLIGNDYTAGGVLLDPLIKIRLYRESVIGILIGVFTLTMLSGLYPAWRAGRVPPVESLKAM